MGARTLRARLALPGLLAAALLSGGCAAVFRSYDVAPSGLQADDDRLRRMLVAGQAPSAFERVRRNAPDDEMLHALYHGVMAYHAGEYAEAARVLDIAAHIADERQTKSISRSAFSLVSSDLVLPYEPGRTERLMIPYYAGLARLRAGDLEGAAVEARRLSLQLQRLDDRDRALPSGIRATLRYIAGALFEAAGEYGDADVAYRNAFAADSGLAAAHREPDEGHASVVLILEQGFVAHRVEQALAVVLLPEEVEAIAHGSVEDRASVSSFVAGRILDRAGFAGRLDAGGRAGALHVPAPDRSVVPRTRRRTVCTSTAGTDTTRATSGVTRVSERRECVEREEQIEGLPYLLKVAWPVFRATGRPAPGRALLDDTLVPMAATADLSDGVLSDFEAERAVILARTVARGAAKLALARGAERQLEDRNEAAARVIGLLGNIGSVLSERADTRSWHLLPSSVSVVRLQVPAGPHRFGTGTGTGTGTGPGGRAATHVDIAVEAGRTYVVPLRAW